MTKFTDAPIAPPTAMVTRSNPRSWLLLSFVVFFGGGIPALIYQVVWQRVLSLYFGVDIYSTTVAVTVFMLGLGVGSMIGGRLADRLGSPVILYAVVELLIGVFGLLSLSLFSAVGSAFAGSPLALLIVVDGLLLLVPTCLMGMTLPLMTRTVVDDHAHIGSRLALLYGLNTLGAAVGALLTAWLLIGLLGMAGAIRVAVSINVLLAFTIFLLVGAKAPRRNTAMTTAGPVPATVHRPANDRFQLSFQQVLACAFLSGFIALGYEIVWYRVIRVLLHGTVYVFGTVLFVFLTGIALGAFAAQRRINEPGWASRFAWCQLGAAAWVFGFFVLIGHFSALPGVRHLISASFFTYFHPTLELVAGQFNLLSLYSALDIPFWTAAILFVPTFLMGYGFPNLMRAGSQSLASLGRSIGAIYFANIVGSAAGSLLTGFVLIHYFGSERTLQLMVVLGALTALAIFWRARQTTASPVGRQGLATVVLPVALIVLAWSVFPGPMQLIKAVHLADFPAVEFEGREDRTGTVVLRRQAETIAFAEEQRIFGQRRLYIDGSVHGGVSDQVNFDEEVQAAFSAHPAPRRVLSIGLGDGHMVAEATRQPGVQQLVVVELNSSLRELIARTPQGELIESNAGKIRYVVDDGRRWLLANPAESFDVIMMWPLHAAHAHSGSLFSAEFMQIIRHHLKPDGLVILRSADYFSTARTVATVFEHVIRLKTQTYVGSAVPLRFSASRAGMSRGALADMITADSALILGNTRAAPINQDLRPNSEFYLTYPFTAYMARGKGVPFAGSPGTMSDHIVD